MNGWMTFWGLLFGVTLAIYAVLLVYVAIGGLKDIKSMFKTLAEEDPPAEDPER